jgi:hypothetical protein
MLAAWDANSRALQPAGAIFGRRGYIGLVERARCVITRFSSRLPTTTAAVVKTTIAGKFFGRSYSFWNRGLAFFAAHPTKSRWIAVSRFGLRRANFA